MLVHRLSNLICHAGENRRLNLSGIQRAMREAEKIADQEWKP